MFVLELLGIWLLVAVVVVGALNAVKAMVRW